MKRPDPFVEIDRIACGAGLVPEDMERRARALQDAARQLVSSGSLASAVAKLLVDRRGRHVALLTGFVLPDAFPCGENDGPLGTVALARALHRASFGVSIYADPAAVDGVTWLAAEIGAPTPVMPIPEDPLGLTASADIAIAIEKPGENAVGYMHTWDGRRIERGSVSIDPLFRALAAADKPTIAVGDRGNEIGFGAIHEEVVSLVPEARRCTCGCGGGIAAVTPADILFPAAVSNWGAYALCAALAVSLQDRSLLLDPGEEERLLHVAAVRGCRDGLLRSAAFGVDGISGAVSSRIVRALRTVVDVARAADEYKAPVRGPIERRSKALHG